MIIGVTGSCLWCVVDGLDRVVNHTAATFFTNRALERPTSSPELATVSIAAFDLDSTLIETISGNLYALNSDDWRFLQEDLPLWLANVSQTHQLVIFTNQGGISLGRPRHRMFREKIKSIAHYLPKNTRLYAATREPESQYRKPGTGMWKLLESHLRKDGMKIDLTTSFYVGDAAGRKQDHSDADILFAKAVGLKFYTPEEWFDQRLHI